MGAAMSAHRVEINRSQFDAQAVVVLPPETPIGSEVYVFTVDELRARDERIIQTLAQWHLDSSFHFSFPAIDAIIAAAEATS
jgi:hypothetical protein